MHRIRSTYAPYAPEYTDYPEGRAWPYGYPSYFTAWHAVRRYLLSDTQQWRDVITPAAGLAPYGHTKAFARCGDLFIFNDAETIEIYEV